MFVCKSCAEKTGWKWLLPMSRGQCELCDTVAVCDDIKHPPPAKPGSLELIRINRDMAKLERENQERGKCALDPIQKPINAGT